MKTIPVITLDAFTTTPFTGNPCAVIPDAQGLDGEQMQKIARETNLPETAFMLPSQRADFRVRYFTPRYEVDFAGHPTIAVTYLIGLDRMVPLKDPVTELTLEFNIGVLPVELKLDQGSLVEAVMTHKLPVFGQQFPMDEVAACFHLPVEELREDAPAQVVSTGTPFLMVPVKRLSTMTSLTMDRDRLAVLLDRAGVNAAYLFCLEGYQKETDAHARLLDPRSAFEDPFTGSAAGGMGAYLVHYGLKSGPFMTLEQGHVVGRPGKGRLEIRCENGQISAVRLGGTAVRVMEGRLLVDTQAGS